MRIEITTTFLDGVDRFEAGDVRTVDDERGARFVAAGWAKDQDGRVSVASTEAVTLDVKNAVMGQEVRHG